MNVSRRKFLSLGAGAFVLLTLPASLPRNRRLVRRSVPVMGTIADLVVVEPDETKAQKAIDAAIRELRWVHETMSHFSHDSDVGRVNSAAVYGPTEPVAVTAATTAVLEEALRWAELSDGRFDPCLGRASALWDVGERQTPPDPARVRRFAGERLYRELELDRWRGEHIVRLRRDEAAIDLGGIAKGYGVDRAVAALREGGVTDALINAGGDLCAIGSSADGDRWEIGVRDPLEPRRLTATIEISNRAVATSGDYFQFFDHGGRRYHHLLDPITGEPTRSESHSVTVAADSCITADAAATTVFGCSESTARQLLAWAAPGSEILHVT